MEGNYVIIVTVRRTPSGVLLRDPYAELLALLAEEAVLNVDEAGHKENNARMWTWCFRAEDYALFKIDPLRGSDV